MKKLFLIEALDYGYDDWDSFVFCAEKKSEAKDFVNDEENFKNCKITCIWIAYKHIKKWVVLWSFNAG